MRRTINAFALLIAGFVFLSFTEIPVATDFSGKWKLNETKSELGQFGNFATRVLEVAQKNDSISILRTANSFDGAERVTKEQLSFDGKEIESTLSGTSKKKSVVAWSTDGKIFTINYQLQLEFNGQSNEIKGKEVWTLSDDGKQLTVKNNSSSSFGDLETTSVYEKQ
jgi:hypothetical protein